MIGSIALPAPPLGDHVAGDRAVDAMVRGPLGAGLDDYLTRGSRFGFTGVALVIKDGAVVLKAGLRLDQPQTCIPN
jgi:hypothetical protein